MTAPQDTARAISYASAARSRGGRAVIRLVENATGRGVLIRRAAGFQDEIAAGRDFWSVMVGRYGLSLDLVQGQLTDIPPTEPVIVIANHPFGILDGLILGHVLAQRRGDFRILAHRVFAGATEVQRVVLPVSFDDTPAAIRENLATRNAALTCLRDGGAVGIFPGGTVSTARHPFGHPADPVWRCFTARMVAKSGATVVPIHFHGANSRVFQVASHLHPTLRMALLLREFRARTDTPVRLSIGAPISPDRLRPLAGDGKAMMDFLRARTYALSGHSGATPLGYEFEAKYRV